MVNAQVERLIRSPSERSSVEPLVIISPLNKQKETQTGGHLLIIHSCPQGNQQESVCHEKQRRSFLVPVRLTVMN